MTQRPSPSERLDRALDDVLSGRSPAAAAAVSAADASVRPLVALGAGLRTALPMPVVAPRFEARLGARLAGGARVAGGARLAGGAQARDPLAWALHHPALVVTGAVGSAAIGVGITAFAVWRHGRRASAPSHRLVHR